MPINRILVALVIFAGLVSLPHLLHAQDPLRGKLAAVKSIKCTFTLMSNGTWTGAQPKAESKTAKLVLEFEAVNADEGTTQLKSGFGQYDIIVRYADGYLHFIQAFLNGPLYTTTVLEKKASEGKLKAMHSRHEFTDFALPGFTSSPEQYYGECEIVN